ncbi:Coiled-coil domain-containing protein 25 [Coemansia javaensis]|uniref:Coiled-coil domain-containing protein 25 n=1 Tax=Coemansia javaensis TaxID=2761396 RepID=A0A9W8HB06_9FUNG|nr:Coiled-coil domain-containing protein 25 [Coemansia javaensis]
MVYYFTSNAVSPPATVYMGKDKFENEELIKHGWPEDVWFHVDKLSSAHVYLRLNAGQTWDAIPQALLDDLAQLCKANSIEGNKKGNIAVIYTPWENLLKRGDMATGQVGFKNQQMVKRVHVAARENAVVNRLNKTRREETPDLVQQRIDRDRREARKRREEAKMKQSEERRVAEERRKDKEARDYGRIFAEIRRDSKPPGDLFGDSDDDGSGGGGHADLNNDFADFI